MNTLAQKDICTPIFIGALLTIAKIWKQPKCPSMGEWIKKMWCVCVCVCVRVCVMKYHSPMKKNEISPFETTWMDVEGIMLSEVSQREKDKYHIISLICGIENRTQMNMSAKQKQTHR